MHSSLPLALPTYSGDPAAAMPSLPPPAAIPLAGPHGLPLSEEHSEARIYAEEAAQLQKFAQNLKVCAGGLAPPW